MSVNKDIIIALDEGTTNAKAVAFDSHGRVIAQFSRALEIATPQEGWVEQSAELLLAASLEVISRAVAAVGAGVWRPRRSATSAKPSWAGIGKRARP